MKLTIELVPSSSFYNNVRSNVSPATWDIIRKQSYTKANNKCEICGDVGTNQGVKHKVECHEIWDYIDNGKECVQKLIGLTSLCPNCHKTKHAGLASIKGETPIVINQLMKVNGMTKEEAEEYHKEAFVLWRKRSDITWELDITYLKENNLI